MTQKITIPHTWTGNTLSFTDLRDGEQYVVSNSHMNYTDIKSAIQANEIEKAVELIKGLKAEFTSNRIIIKDGILTYQGLPVYNSISNMILRMSREGMNFDALANFLNKLMENPSYRSREQLHGFIEKYLFSITPEGDFLAYRKVTEDYKDHFTGKMNNAIGEVVSMPRGQIDEDPERECSYGLHVCGRSYIECFGTATSRTVLVSVSPTDVVAIPTDYEHAKMRVCRFKVLMEIASDFEESHISPVVTPTKIQLRDSKGRFTSKMAYETNPPHSYPELDVEW